MRLKDRWRLRLEVGLGHGLCWPRGSKGRIGGFKTSPLTKQILIFARLLNIIV